MGVFFLMFFFFDPLSRPLSPRLWALQDDGDCRPEESASSPAARLGGAGWAGAPTQRHPAETLALRPSEALEWKRIYTLNNTLTTSGSQRLGFEYRYNRILQAT